LFGECANLAKKKFEIKDEDEEILENQDMFMSIKDFEERMVVLPEFGRKKKGAGGMHQDASAEEPVEEPEEVGVEGKGGDEVDDDETDVDAEGDSEDESGDEEEEEEEGDEFCNRECYEFNSKMGADLDDKCCRHCKKYLTLHCPHIKEFMDEVEEGDVD
jgi:hypothetical protein